MKKLIALILSLSTPLHALEFSDGGSGATSSTSDATVDDLTVNGNTTLGSNGDDAVTLNADAVTFASDTAVTLSGGLDGLNFDANTMSIDGANNRVGFGTAAPAYPIEISEASTPHIGLHYTGAAAAGNKGKVVFSHNRSSDSTQEEVGFIQGVAEDNQSDGGGRLVGRDGAAGDVEALRWTSNGYVVVNSTFIAPSGPFQVNNPAAETIAAAATITANGCGTLKLISAGGAVTTNTTNTFTAPAEANKGCIMYVCNSGANNITLDNNANFKSAGGADVVVTPDDCLLVGSTGASGVWYQLSALLAN